MVRASRSLTLTLALVLVGSLPGTSAGAADEDGSDPGRALGPAIFDQIAEVATWVRTSSIDRRRAKRFCGDFVETDAAKEACLVLFRYSEYERVLRRLEQQQQGRERAVERLREELLPTLSSASTPAVRSSLEQRFRRECTNDEWGKLRDVLNDLTGIERAIQVRGRLIEQHEVIERAVRGRGVTGERLEQVDLERLGRDLERLSTLSQAAERSHAEIRDLCERLQERIGTLGSGAYWQLQEPLPEFTGVDVVTGFEGFFDPESEELQLLVAYDTKWPDEDLVPEDVHYDIAGWFTRPPDRLDGGETLTWTIGARVEGKGEAPFRLFMCYSARGISGRVPDRCAVVGLPASRFPEQSQTTEVTFDVPEPAGPDDVLLVEVNAGTLAPKAVFRYEPVSE